MEGTCCRWIMIAPSAQRKSMMTTGSSSWRSSTMPRATRHCGIQAVNYCQLTWHIPGKMLMYSCQFALFKFILDLWIFNFNLKLDKNRSIYCCQSSTKHHENSSLGHVHRPRLTYWMNKYMYECTAEPFFLCVCLVRDKWQAFRGVQARKSGNMTAKEESYPESLLMGRRGATLTWTRYSLTEEPNSSANSPLTP